MTDPLAPVHDELAALAAAGLHRSVRSLTTAQEPVVERDGRALILLSSNNYLGLATDARVVDAAAEAARRWGAGAGAARLISGGTTVHDALEEAVAALAGTEAALLFSSGYLANLGTIDALTDAGDVIVSDERNHASIIDGARLSRAQVRIYRHGDAAHARALLEEHAGARRRLLVTDSVFSMDGDLAPLPALTEACERTGSILMVDESHATGVIGPQGRGAVAHFGLEGRVPVVMSTLSKAFGAAGGTIAGSRALIDLLRNRARSFVFDTAPPPPVAAAALAAIAIARDEPWRAERTRALAQRLADGMRRDGRDVPRPAAAIVPIVVGSSQDALALSRALEDAGYLIPAIRPPTVPEGTARLRATTMATHEEAHIDGFLAAVAEAARAA